MMVFVLCLVGPMTTLASERETQIEKSGWIQEDGRKYYLDQKSGVMQTGWIFDNGKWYYLNENGIMKTGWLYQNGKWYFLANNGVMETGWLLENGRWYYLQQDGDMSTGWIYDNNKWYYSNADGAMKTGWLLDNGKWYFLNNNGDMATGWVLLEKWYYLSNDGSWIENTVADELKTIWDHDQLILVTTNGYNTTNARIRTFEKVSGKWNQVLDIPGYIGKLGFAVEMKEGGQKSPRGTYKIGTAFGRNVNPGTKLPYRQIDSDDVWVDDSQSTLYNTWQKGSENSGRWKSAEKMNIPAYNYGFVINYNTEAGLPGAGSAIFFHVGSSYTLGCTATDQDHVISLLKWLDPNKNPVIIQTPESELQNY